MKTIKEVSDKIIKDFLETCEEPIICKQILMNNEPKTLETLEAGDTVSRNDGFDIDVLAVFNRNKEKTVYLMSYYCNKKIAGNIYTAHQLKENGFEPLIQDSQEITNALKVLTDNGRIVDGKIIV